MNEEQRIKLWKEYKENNKKELRDKIILEYAPLVKIIAGKLSLYLSSTVEFEDLNSYGIFGLIDAIDKFDINANVKFETYASLRIRGAILDSIRKQDWIPRTLRQKQKQLENAKVELRNDGIFNITDEILAKKLDISVEELNDLESKLLLTNVISLDDFYVNEKGDTESNAKGIPQNSFDTPEECYDKNELVITLQNALSCLTDKERRVIELIYYDDLTSKEVSTVLEVSESRVSQIHSKALRKLREPMGKYMGILVNKERIGL